jgi:hypothetical protein
MEIRSHFFRDHYFIHSNLSLYQIRMKSEDMVKLIDQDMVRLFK